MSKGAILVHRNVIAALLQYRAWLARPSARSGRYHHRAAALSHLLADGELPGDDLVGGENVLITNPRDIPGFVKELAKHKYSMITGVNTLFNALLNNPDFAKP